MIFVIAYLSAPTILEKTIFASTLYGLTTRPMNRIIPVVSSRMRNRNGWSARKATGGRGRGGSDFTLFITTAVAAAALVPSSLTSMTALWMTSLTLRRVLSSCFALFWMTQLIDTEGESTCSLIPDGSELVRNRIDSPLPPYLNKRFILVSVHVTTIRKVRNTN